MRALAIFGANVTTERGPRGAGPLIGVAILLFFVLSVHLPEGWKAYPDHLVVPFDAYIRAAMAWLTSDTPQIPGLPPISSLTRGLAAGLDTILQVLKSSLANGFGADDAGSGGLPPIPWYMVIALFALSGWRLGGARLSLLTMAGLGFIAVTGNWKPAMETLASVAASTCFATALGLLLGILAYMSRTFDRIQSPILDVMQTVPVFAYLVPVLLLLGFGPSAALAATVVYAMPPMIRNTLLGLRRVPTQTVEFGLIAGCTRIQLIRHVLVPSAREIIMVGVNQAIMMSLNMVIIASMIGAGGLGYRVLTALRRLQIGVGLEAGLAIVALAIIMDRQSQALAHRTNRAGDKHGRAILGATILSVVAAWLLSWKGPLPANYPSDYVFATTAYLDDLTRWITINFSDTLDQLKTYFLIWVMLPVRHFVQDLPWFALPLCAGAAGLLLRGVRLGLLCAGLLTLIFVAGLQAPALTTVYLCALGTAASLAIGVPLGVLAGKSDWANRILNVVCDTLQTLPSFVYLIPVIMLFRVGDFSAVVAIVAFAVAPAIRYTSLGIRRVPPQIVEACLIAGCTPPQLLWRVELPLAVPEILLGISQTIVMALSMLVITALVGTRDLGQETFIALAHADAGQGVVAGLAIAFLAIVTDRLLHAWSQSRLEVLGVKS